MLLTAYLMIVLVSYALSLINAFCFVHNNKPIYVFNQVNIFNLLLPCQFESQKIYGNMDAAV